MNTFSPIKENLNYFVFLEQMVFHLAEFPAHLSDVKINTQMMKTWNYHLNLMKISLRQHFLIVDENQINDKGQIV